MFPAAWSTHTHTHTLSTGGNCLLVSTRRGYRQQLTSRSPHNLFWMLPWKQNMRLSCWHQNQQLPCLLCIEHRMVAALEPFSFGPIAQRIFRWRFSAKPQTCAPFRTYGVHILCLLTTCCSSRRKEGWRGVITNQRGCQTRGWSLNHATGYF